MSPRLLEPSTRGKSERHFLNPREILRLPDVGVKSRILPQGAARTHRYDPRQRVPPSGVEIHRGAAGVTLGKKESRG